MALAKITEISSSSNVSFEDAIKAGVARASETLDNISGAWVKEMKVDCDGEKITSYRVTMKLTFILKG